MAVIMAHQNGDAVSLRLAPHGAGGGGAASLVIVGWTLEVQIRYGWGGGASERWLIPDRCCAEVLREYLGISRAAAREMLLQGIWGSRVWQISYTRGEEGRLLDPVIAAGDDGPAWRAGRVAADAQQA